MQRETIRHPETLHGFPLYEMGPFPEHGLTQISLVEIRGLVKAGPCRSCGTTKDVKVRENAYLSLFVEYGDVWFEALCGNCAYDWWLET